MRRSTAGPMPEMFVRLSRVSERREASIRRICVRLLNSQFSILNYFDEPCEESPILGHRIGEPCRRHEPDEGEDGDHPDVVGQRRALVGPEEGAVEDAA